MQNIAIIQQGTGRYLFSVPENVTLREGDRVKCDTKRGITDGIAFADSAWVDENVSQLIGKLLGAKFPLKPVVGKTVTSVEMFEQPEQPKQEPVRLYCVADMSNCVGTLTKGKVYEFVSGSGLTYDNGAKSIETSTYERWARDNRETSSHLVPLVSRPAKVGEWVLLDRDDCFGKNKGGYIAKVVGVPSNTTAFCFIIDPTREYSGGICVCFESDYSYVLDGYKPEPEAEPEPEYWSGKVVCVGSSDNCFTVGKIYEFVNGQVKDGIGDKRPMFRDRRFKSVDEWNKAYGMLIAQFIEFKGEAHD